MKLKGHAAALVVAGFALSGGNAMAQYGGGGRLVDFSMTNFTNHIADVVHAEGEDFHVEKTVGPGETYRGRSGHNDVWGWADVDTGEVFKSTRINPLNRRLNLRESDIHIGEPQPIGFDLLVRNRTDEDLFVSREIPRMGMKRMTAFGTLKAWKSFDLPLEPGMKWIIEDKYGTLVKSGVGDPRSAVVSIVSRDLPPKEASLTLHNYHNFTVGVMKRHGNHSDEVAVIRPMHRVTIKGYPGTEIYIEQISTGRVFRKITISGRDEFIQLRGIPRHDYDDDDHDHDDDDDRFRNSYQIGRGGILRAIGDAID